MTILQPLLMQASGTDATFAYSAQQHRLLIAAMLSEGVLGSTHWKVTQRAAGANFTVDIAPGKAVIVGDSVAGQGSYFVENDAAGLTGVVIPAAPASGTRIHRIVLKIRDRTHDGAIAAGIYDAIPLVLEDTGTGTPALPPSAINLATVTVTSTTTSITNSAITDIRATSVAGGTYGVGENPAWDFSGSGQSVPNATNTRYIPTIINEAVGLTSSSAANTDASVTIATAGRYHLTLAGRFAAGGAAGERTLYIGVTDPVAGFLRLPGSATYTARTCTMLAVGTVRLMPGAVIQPVFYQESGGALTLADLAGGNKEARFTGVLLDR